MLGSVRGLIACCFPTINYGLQLMGNLPPALLVHLAPISCLHSGWKQKGTMELSRVHRNGKVWRRQQEFKHLRVAHYTGSALHVCSCVHVNGITGWYGLKMPHSDPALHIQTAGSHCHSLFATEQCPHQIYVAVSIYLCRYICHFSLLLLALSDPKLPVQLYLASPVRSRKAAPV